MLEVGERHVLTMSQEVLFIFDKIQDVYCHAVNINVQMFGWDAPLENNSN